MSIYIALRHRATVSRPTRTQDGTGQWVELLSQIADRVRCQVVPTEWQPGQTLSFDSQSDISGFAYFAPGTDIRPGDVLTIKGTTYTVRSDGGSADDPFGHSHHQRWAVSQG